MVPALLLAVTAELAGIAGKSFIELLQSEPAVRAPAIAGMDSLSCVRVQSWRASAAGDEVAVDLLAEGTTGLGTTRDLPAHWRLTLMPGSARIATVRTLETVVAEAIADARDDAAAQAAADACIECDKGALAEALEDVAMRRAFFDPWTNPVRYDTIGVAARLAAEDGGVTSQVGLFVAYAYLAVGAEHQLAAARAALTLAEARGSCDELAMARFALGNALTNHGDLDGGARMLQQTAALVDRVEDPRRPLRALHNLAVQLGSRGKFPQAMGAATTLADLAARYGWQEGEAAALLDLADLFASASRFDLSTRARERAYAIFRALGNDEWAAETLISYAATEADRGNRRHAVALFERGIALGRRLIMPARLAISISALAGLLAHEGRFAEAERRLSEARALVPDVGGHIGFGAAEVELMRHRPRHALALIDVALQLPDRYWDMTWTLQWMRGRALLALGRRREAEQAFRAAVETLERRRGELPADAAAREHFFASRAAPYHELIALLAADGRVGEALRMAERLKARTLVDVLAFPPRAGTSARERELAAHLARQRQLFARGALGGDAVARAREELDAFRSEVRWRNPAAGIDEPPPSPAVVPRGTAFVAYVVAAEATTVFVVRDGTIRVRRIAAGRAALARRVDALDAAIAARRLDYATFAAPLGRLLLRPIEPWLAGATRVTIAPDEALWRVPFALLPLRSGQPFVAAHELAFAPSMRMLAARPRRQQAPHLVAFGNPSVFAAPAPLFEAVRLPETATEVASIARTYAPRAEVYTDAESTEERFKRRAAAAEVIHVAAHAVVSVEWPMESSLLLAPGGTDDGVLEAQEILDLHLHCDVAVLAGCNTAGGSFGAGEGVFGLSWAFLAAGAQNAVVSQWNVDSAATEKLMVSFHQHLAAGAAPASALRRAELALRADPAFAHPFYWAPFVVIGSGW
jgi:CHAT domain-containing protein/tetratricopeptide (TPR) repeat protein